MKRTLLGGKIHRATVTDANLHYEGSVTVDQNLLDAAGILEFEQVHVWNVTRGTRFVTYTFSGPRDSGVICVNGAAAHHVEVGDLVIIASFVVLEDAEAHAWRPKAVFVDRHNRLTELRPEKLPVDPLPLEVEAA